ncbi:thiopeptide-type bacteriocin biosynthesis protein [Flavobacterium piscisymbiosum]|uniref:Thiopeptide-type bacteriocin biosynthesis protein n=1 Tax=Flavobacterium piscisymbiosum TaxID=2893753 RepID=A0ABS8MDQ4_9FLAO|nr:thiopeptide-type bacteriocin biosynthesis protein [Flavobacterium sp. F-30]MCC9063589.1 thiopeptide-type bacteriocin biosynthesis protein [Flavobacterium sp. F-30]
MQRNFIIGDHWIYYKIYTGYTTSDRILSNIIRPIADYLIDNGIIDKWFYIRYNDPEYHLRIRLYCINKEDYSKIITLFHESLKNEMENNTIWNVELHSYKRELERYGFETINESEEIFFQDSTLITDFMKIAEGENMEETRWLFALAMIDRQLDSFLYSLSDKLKLMKELKENFYQEFNNSKLLRRQISEKYRNEKSKVFHFFENLSIENNDSSMNSILQVKAKNTEKTVAEILYLKQNGKLLVDFDSLISSYIHMSMNRLFRSSNRKHELICYEFLFNYYTTSLVLNKFNVPEKGINKVNLV